MVKCRDCRGRLGAFWGKTPRLGGKIEALATDMLPTNINAGLTHLPETTLVLDHFYVIKLYHDNSLICRKNFIARLSTGCETGDQGDWLADPQESRQSRQPPRGTGAPGSSPQAQ